MAKFIVVPQFLSDGSPSDNEIYYVGDDELDRLAEAALYDADIEEAAVYVGDPDGPDAVKTHQKVFGQLTTYKVESFRGDSSRDGFYDSLDEAIEAIAHLCGKSEGEIADAVEGVDYVEFDHDDGVCCQYAEAGGEICDHSPALTTIVKTLADKAREARNA